MVVQVSDLGEVTEKVAELKKAIHCLAVQVPEEVHRDVHDKVYAVLEILEGLIGHVNPSRAS